MKGIRDANTIIGLLEDGDLAADLSTEIQKVFQALRDQAGPKTSAKGSVTLTMNFEVEGVSMEVDASITSKIPKPKRGKSFFFVTDDGLSTEHPKQANMFPEDVSRRQPA